MMSYQTLRKLLFLLDAEKSHHLSLKILKHCPAKWLAHYLPKVADKPVQLWGLSFNNPVGLAAGFDKDGQCLSAWSQLGFGFVEVGTVTPKPQAGNPKPRLFRIPQVNALINRMGFNNLGVEQLVSQLKNRPQGLIVGANIGKNKTTPNETAVKDYLYCLNKLYLWADYIAINISSPNTPGLRDLFNAHSLEQLLSQLIQRRNDLWTEHQIKRPLLLKLTIDHSQADLAKIVTIAQKQQIDGILCTNTSVDHQMVAQYLAKPEQGGLSGQPIFEKNLAMIRFIKQISADQLPVIAVGGIFSAADAQAYLSSGADFVQLYTGLVYQGPKLIHEIVQSID